MSDVGLPTGAAELPLIHSVHADGRMGAFIMAAGKEYDSMAEKKVTKAEMKKLETQKLREFTYSLYAQAMEAAVKGTENERGKIQVQVSGTNYNRYVRFSGYGKSCVILIYKNGNVGVKLDEMFHDLFETTIFEYVSDEVIQQAFKEQFAEMLEWLVPTFYENLGYDYHAFMDFIDWEKDLFKAHERIEKEYPRCSENKTKEEIV